MPGFEIAPGRATEIQQALAQAGDLHEPPTGRWDGQTRQAMRLYQHQNGFSPTGLPDAKSLMKMGLGPHALPAQVDPLAPPAGAGYADSSPAGSTGPQSLKPR
ncbi:MAG: peptidoglycan-binding domain-containing protein [Terriglobia bacterium]